MSYTIEVYSPTARKYKAVKPARTRIGALERLSLLKGKARAKDLHGVIFATRTEVDGLGRLNLVK